MKARFKISGAKPKERVNSAQYNGQPLGYINAHSVSNRMCFMPFECIPMLGSADF